MEDVDVLIAGAGPTGMVLALWLAHQGVRVAIVDKAAAPGTTSRAMAVQARTLELYRQLGLADEVVAEGKQNLAINLWVRGKRKAHLSFRSAGARLTPYPFVLIYPQDQHELLLERHLARAGVRILRETELLDFEDDGARVVARLRTPGGEHLRRARFLAGCDGARSTVRHKLGAGFAGGTYDRIFYVADVQVRGLAADDEVHLSLETADFVILLAYSSEGRGRLIGTIREERENEGARSFDDVSQRAMRSLGLQVDQVYWFSTYRVHHRVTDHYRRGNVFLLGDAAHVHSPAGGQGMNTGIGDAINLAWKLAAVLKAEAPDALLDSYEAERLAFARKLVDTTDRLFTFVTAEGNFADFVRTRIAPLFASAAYSLDPVRELIFRIISQTTISYRDSPLSDGVAGEVHGGDRLPWALSEGQDNYAPLARIGWQAQVFGAPRAALADWCARHGLPLRSFHWGRAHEEAGLERNAAYLVRPDYYVGLSDPAGSPDAIAGYLEDRGLRLAP
jgi:2-polyprenyl-6-methoxyphenol hydroxylase-like FAD-dependent oxidoreductase